MFLLSLCYEYSNFRNLAYNSLLRLWSLQNVRIAGILSRKFKMFPFKLEFSTVCFFHIIQRIKTQKIKCID